MSIQLTLAARYLMGRKLRTFLTTLAVILGVMIIFGLNGMLVTMTTTFRQNMLATAGYVDLTVTSASENPFDAAALDTVRQVAGIAYSSGILRLNLLLPTDQKVDQPPSKFSSASSVGAVTVVGVDPDAVTHIHSFAPTSGRFLTDDDENADVIVISESLAEKLNLAVGQVWMLPSTTGKTDFEIVGIISTRVLPGAEEVYVPLRAAQTLFNQAGRINTIEAIYAPNVDKEQVETDVQLHLGSDYKLGVIEAGSQLMAALKMGEFILNLFGVLALAMGGFVIFNTFRTVVAERRRDLGMLRAVGASRGTIIGIILVESLLQGVLGTLIGLVAGYLFAAGLAITMNPVLEQFLRMRIGMPSFTVNNLILAVVLGVGVTVLGGLYPALSASQVSPLEALRPTISEAYHRVARRRAWVGVAMIVVAAIGLLGGNAGLAGLSALLFLLGLLLVSPVLIKPISSLFGRLLTLVFAREGHLAEGNMARQPGRAAVTASAMMIGLAIMITLIGMVESVRYGFMYYLDKSLGADFLLMPSSMVLAGGNVGAGSELTQRIREVPGVAGSTSLRLAMAQTQGAMLQVIGIDPQTYPAISGLEFSAGDEKQAYAALAASDDSSASDDMRAIIANGIFAAQNRIKIGDVLMLKTPEGDKEYRVVGVAMDYLNAKLATAYISQASLETDFHQTNDLLVLINQTPGADTAAIRAALSDIAADYPAFTLFESAPWKTLQEQTFLSAMSVLYLMIVVMALPSLLALINTLVIGVIERTREIGMIRAVGGTQRQVRRMILAESLLLSGAGTGFGILAGLWMGYVLIEAMNVSGFKMPYYFPYGGILATVAVGMILGAFAALIPARQAARLDIIAALHYE